MTSLLRQIGALPLRRLSSGEIEVLLVTSRETGRWIIPKGWPMKGLSDRKAAEQEALEEAGVKGVTLRDPVGTYGYFKRTSQKFDLITVTVYSMWVEKECKSWPEKDQRQRRWFDLDEAEKLVGEPGLVSILRAAASS